MKELNVFIQFPIHLSIDLDIDRKTNLCRVDALKDVGDHPGLQQEKFSYSKPLPKNTLFIKLEDGKLESLFPFLTVQHCPACRSRETYFIDSWDGMRFYLKSFERGHSEKDGDVDSSRKGLIQE